MFSFDKNNCYFCKIKFIALRKKYFLTAVALLMALLSFGQTPYISEIHYDNCGSSVFCLGPDTDEGVEIAGAPEFDLDGWKIILYDGKTGKKYHTEKLSGKLPDNGILWVPIKGIDDGKEEITYPITFPLTFISYPGGIALVNTNIDPADVVEFLSYEGSFTAKNGPASGMTSTDISVYEDREGPVGNSLQKTDAGWVGPVAATPGKANSGQTLSVDNNTIEGFKLYPNPVSNGVLNITSNDYVDKQVEIYSTLGKQVFSKTIQSNETIDVSYFNPGLYMVRVEQEGKTVTRKLIVK